MHYHLDPVGGIAGDMFAAAMLDHHRDWQDELTAAIATSGLKGGLEVQAVTHTDSILTGHRLLVTEPTAAGVRLVWEAPAADGEYGYNVYRSAPATAWPDAPLNPAPLAPTEYLDSTVETGQSYAYTVRVALAP